MPTRITQVDIADSPITILRIEGALHTEDVEVLERVCRDLRQQSRDITLDLAGLNFLDSDSASALSRLKREQGIALEGEHQFIQKVIEIAEQAT